MTTPQRPRPSEEMRAAREAGRAAAEAHRPPDSNPYNGTGPTARERVLSVMWRRGYSSVTRDFPINYDS